MHPLLISAGNRVADELAEVSRFADLHFPDITQNAMKVVQ